MVAVDRPDSPAALSASRLTKRYGRRGPLALLDVDLSVPIGSFVALVGPNGAGKSTLMRTWMGFERPTAGSVALLGVDPARERVAALSKVAYLAQTPSLYRDLTVADHLDLVARYQRRAFDRSLAERRLTDIGVSLQVRIRSLSGGQAAQLGLALAIGLRARIVLLDEPLASLDPLARREFIDALLDVVRASGATVVLSSHIVSDLELACDRLIVLGQGRILVDDSLDTVGRTHWISDVPGSRDGVVGRLPGALDRWVVRQSQPFPGARSAGLEDVVLAYLAALKGDGS